MTYDYFVAGRTRNRDEILRVVEVLRSAKRSVYCFLDNSYESKHFNFDADIDPESSMQAFEAVKDWRNDKTFQRIYKQDMEGLKDSKKFIIVFPAGLSAHMELGVAFGMGKLCYGIGEVEKPESLYLMLNEIYPDAKKLVEQVA